MPIEPHLVVPDADAAAGWYVRAFGAERTQRITLPGGHVLIAAVRIAGTDVHLAGELPDHGIVGPGTLGGSPVVLQLLIDDADAWWSRAVDAGAEVVRELADQVWGERHGQLTDPFGHRWNVAQHLRDVSDDEVATALAAAFGAS